MHAMMLAEQYVLKIQRRSLILTKVDGRIFRKKHATRDESCKVIWKKSDKDRASESMSKG